jgi:hypothetical protein
VPGLEAHVGACFWAEVATTAGFIWLIFTSN